MIYAIQPFEYLKALELCAIQYSVEVPEEETRATFWDGVSFRLNDYLFTVGISEITEILPVPQVTPLPGVKPWAKGIANVHGRLIPIIDLRVFFDLPTSSEAGYQRIIIIEQKELSVGVIVDEVYGRQRIPLSDHQKIVPAELPENILPFTNGCYQQDDRYIVFGAEQLVVSDNFLAAASE